MSARESRPLQGPGGCQSTGEAMAAAATARRARTKLPSGIGITPISPVSNVVPLAPRTGRSA
jgi:hypothetical protein